MHRHSSTILTRTVTTFSYSRHFSVTDTHWQCVIYTWIDHTGCERFYSKLHSGSVVTTVTINTYSPLISILIFLYTLILFVVSVLCECVKDLGLSDVFFLIIRYVYLNILSPWFNYSTYSYRSSCNKRIFFY